ncbi:MAG: NADH-quinone oxidoreductase subunit NuoE [Desulfobulbaceae bacterium]
MKFLSKDQTDMDATDLEKLESVYARYLEEEGNAVSLLQDIQSEFGYIPEHAVNWIAAKSGLPPSKLYGVVTFYAQFHMKPRGRNIITACCGTVCHVKGAHRILFQLNEELSFPKGEDTTRDGLFTLEKVACLGACSIAPVVVINQQVYGRMTPDKVVKKLQAIRKRNNE